MTHGSLFSGIGGFDYAAKQVGWQNAFAVEMNSFCQKVLSYHFPTSKIYDDVKKFDGTNWRGSIDVLSGGFPCQPYSAAGKRLGTADERHLWPEMLRIIREIAPRWVVAENVRGLVNWSNGLVFEQVCADLEAADYQVQAFILPACGVGAPHRRDRIWFVAYRNSSSAEHEISAGRNLFAGNTWDAANAQNIGQKQPWPSWDGRPRSQDSYNSFGDAANADSNERRERRVHQTEQKEAERYVGARDARRNERQAWHNFPTESPICGRNDGISAGLDGITFSKWRNESIKAYGNAIVPQVAMQIFSAINSFQRF